LRWPDGPDRHRLLAAAQATRDRIVTNDLTLEREHHALAERVEHLMKSANDIILITDDRWHILEANDRAASVYGYTAEELRRVGVTCVRRPRGPISPCRTRASDERSHNV